ncbi:MAG TPA: hypothetical protein VNB94_01195 [Mycobacteriales bacterium]|nr:hypothetical protein [Mycobacteriales bacterium]
MTSVVVCGIAGQLPLAGVALHYLQYCLGLRDLGVDVLYLEDNRAWPYDPFLDRPDEEATYSRAWLAELFTAFDLPWAYRDPMGRYSGATEADVHAACASADVLLNVSGGHDPDAHHRAAARLVFVDTDPGFVQVAAASGNARTRAWLEAHDVLLTFAESWGSPTCRLPDDGYPWRTTRQPVHLPFWAETPDVPGDVWTTVMNWRAYAATEWQGEAWGQKDAEFPLIRDLPRRAGLPLELGLGGADAPREALAADGWRLVDPRIPTRTVWTFRDYLAASRGEITVAKQAYVRSRGGWFSERSANYLAAGRPVVAQDTGWSEHLPTGKGLLAFGTGEEAESALLEVESDVAGHAAAARRLAAEHFDARDVLTRLLSDCGL